MTEPKIVLVTGGTKGIGLGTCRALSRDGHTVLLGARDPGRGAVAAASVPGARAVPLDVTDQASVDAAAALIDAEYGHLDVLVNNAGISRDRDNPPTEMPVADLRAVYETNVFGVVAVTNAMLPLLRRSAAPSISNVSSGLGTVAVLTGQVPELAPYATLLAYNTSKAALNAVTLIYAAALRADGIVVNAVSPGFCATDLNGHIGVLSADEGGAHIARQVIGGPTGVFCSETGGTVPW